MDAVLCIPFSFCVSHFSFLILNATRLITVKQISLSWSALNIYFRKNLLLTLAKAFKLKPAVIISLLFCSISLFTSAQTPQLIFDQYTTDNGLSNNQCSSIAQDEDGFIWIATTSGLNRFDGKDFVKYYATGSANQLPSNTINKIVCLSQHRLAAGSSGGLAILNTKTGAIQQLIIPAKEGLKAATNEVRDVIQDKKGNLIVATAGGLYVFDSTLKLIFRHDAYALGDIGKKRLLFSNRLHFLPDGRVLLLGNFDSIYVLNIEKKTMFNINNVQGNEFNLFKPWNGNQGYVMDNNSQGQFFFIRYISPVDSLLIIDFVRQKAIAAALPFSVEKYIHYGCRVIPINDSVLAITSNFFNGIFLTGHDKNLKIGSIKTILPGTLCTDILIDKNKRIWVASNEGFFKQSFTKAFFNNTSPPGDAKLFPVVHKNETYYGKGVMGFVHYQNKYFVSQYLRGLLVYDDSLHFIRSIDFQKAGKKNWPWNVSYFTRDTLLISNATGALLVNTINYGIKNFWQPGMPATLDSIAQVCSFIDTHHYIWMSIGSGNGVLRMNLISHEWKYFSPKIPGAIFKLRYPVSIGEDKDGNIWMAGAEGITRWNYKKQTFDTLITKLPGIGDIIGSWTFFTIDEKNNMWVTAKGPVLVKWNLTTQQFTYFPLTTAPPLWVEKIIGPFDNRLWIISNRGLLSFNTKTAQFALIKKSDGLYNESIPGNLYFDTSARRLFVGFDNAFTWFNPQDILKERKPVSTIITGVKKINDSLSFAGDSSLSFSYKDNSFIIDFTGINYDDGENNEYAYRLFEDKPAAFINIGEQKTVTFASLKPGNYTFQVKTILPDGTESKTPTSLHVGILFPFYETWWFYLLCAVVIIAGLYALYRSRIDHLLQLQRVRNNISADLHDDIGARLTNINILSALGEQKVNEPQQASDYLKRISNEVQTSGEALDDIVWSINTKNDSVEEITARMRRYATEVLDGTTIKHSIDTNENILTAKLSMEKRRYLFLIYKEAINNVRKHAMATEVKINIEARNSSLLMQVQDNGKGFDMQHPTHRNGLKNMQQRLEKWKGTFTLQSAPGNGTILKIKLPLQDASLKRTIWKWVKNR